MKPNLFGQSHKDSKYSAKIDQLSLTFPIQREFSNDVMGNVTELLQKTGLLECLGDFDKCKAFYGYTNAVGWNNRQIMACFSPISQKTKFFFNSLQRDYDIFYKNATLDMMQLILLLMHITLVGS